MDERDSLRRGSVFASGASTASSRRSGWALVILAGLGLLAGSCATFRRRANGNFRAIQKLVESSHSNNFLRLNALHGGHRPIRSAGCNRPHGGGLVTLNQVDISALGVALNRRSRDQSRIVLRVDEQFDVHELAREKSVVGVVKDGF